MSIPRTLNDPRVRIFVNNTWKDVYRRVRQADGGIISIQLGNEDEALGDEINPGICELTFDNLDGAFTPDNPMSPYWPDLEVSTPICVLNDEIWDLFSRVHTNTWGVTSTGETYATKSVNGAINATDYSVDGSSGVHSVPATNAFRMTYLGSASGAPSFYNGVQKIRMMAPFSDVTGTGSIEPANLVCRLQSDTQYYLLRAELKPDQRVTLEILRDGGTVIASEIDSGITFSGQPLWFAMGAFDDKLYGTVWEGDDIEDEPTDWKIVSNSDNTYGYGFYGVRTGVETGNTNALPIIIKYDNYRVYVSQFNGEIPEWPQEFSEDGKDKIVPVVASGILRRYAESKSARRSALRYHYETELGLIFNQAPDYYWPLDDGELSTEGRSTVGLASAPFHFNFALGILGGVDTSREKHFSQAKMGAWLPNGVNVLPTEIFQTLPPGGTADCVNDRWIVDWVRTGGSGTNDQFVITGYLDPGVTILGVGVDAWSIQCDAGTQDIIIAPGIDNPTITIDATTLLTNVFDGAAHHFRLAANVTGGTDVFWELTIDDHVIDNNIETAHPFLASIGAVYMTSLTGTKKPTGLCSVAIFVTRDSDPSISTTYLRFLGSLGEEATVRAERLLREEGIQDFITTIDGMTMGPQFFDDTLFEQLEELMRTDGGIIRELQSARAVHYDTLSVLRSRAVGLTLNVGNKEIARDSFKPVRDNQTLKNKVRAEKRAGSDYTYEKTTGRLGSADPKLGGAGVKDDKISVNPELDSQLISIAQREVAEGTVDKPRFPTITVDVMSSNIRGNLAQRRKVLDTFVSTRLKLTNMQDWFLFEDSDLLVVGHQRILSPWIHQITWNTIPYNSLDVFRVETAGSILGTDSSTITAGVDTDDTALDVTTIGKSLWTTDAGSFPILTKMNGEDISVTNITTTAPAVRSVGAASHADNASVTPALPAGHVTEDSLILVSVIRNTAATANLPAGYADLTTGISHLRIAMKIDNGAEVAPSCTYSGGAAGDTTSAFMIALNTSTIFIVGNSQTNASAQNIAFPAFTPDRSNGILLYFGWKQDDYTSVLPPAWLTEVVEVSTVTGNDQSLYVASVAIPQGERPMPSGSFTVTGGAAAVSKGIVLYFHKPQRFTIVRSINEVVKSHSSGSSIRIAYPKVLG